MTTAKKVPVGQRLAILLALALGVFIIDQLTKKWAVANLAGQPARTYGLIFTTTYAENLGAWGSLGAGWGDNTRLIALGIFPALVLAILAIYASFAPEFTRGEIIGCSLVIGGGVGNLVDRFRLGYVQDFLYIGYGPIGTNIFNIADAVVMLGLGIILLKGIQHHRLEKELKSKPLP